MVPVPDQWCPLENRCQVTEVALVDLCLAVGLGSGRVPGERRRSAFCFTRVSGLLTRLLLISHVGSNLYVHHDRCSHVRAQGQPSRVQAGTFCHVTF